MKLFVWADPYGVRWGSSAFYAVAETEEEARKIAETSKRYSFFEYEDTDAPHPTLPLKPPTRVVDLPCGEWHEWSE